MSLLSIAIVFGVGFIAALLASVFGFCLCSIAKDADKREAKIKKIDQGSTDEPEGDYIADELREYIDTSERVPTIQQ